MKTYITRHLQAMSASLNQLSRAPLASLMTCMIIGITLALPTALFVALKNFAAMSGNLKQTMQVTVYLKSSSKESDANKLKSSLEANSLVSSIKLISPNQGLKELQQSLNFNGVLTDLPNNPLPWTLVVLPKSTQDLKKLALSLQQMPNVDTVQLDETWVARLASFIMLSQRIIYALTIFLGIAVFLIINNAIRSATQQNQKEIEIIKLIGGTYFFIRRPFLYAGMIYGLLGGIIAWQLVDILLLLLKQPISQLSLLYQSNFQLSSVGISNSLILLGISMLLGFLASWSAVTNHLKNCES